MNKYFIFWTAYIIAVIAFFCFGMRSCGTIKIVPVVKVYSHSNGLLHYKNVTAFSYTSSTDECDADPWTNASGGRPHVGSIACNWLPFGTRIFVPGNPNPYIVDDRMSSRWNGKAVIDIWVTDKKVSAWFGKRRFRIAYVHKEDIHGKSAKEICIIQD